MLELVDRVVRAPRGGTYSLRLTVGRKRIRALSDSVVVRLDEAEGGVAIEVLATRAIDESERARAIEVGVGLAGLDDDPTGLETLVKRNPMLSKLHRKYAGARLGRSPTVFESFAIAVVGQLVTFEEARAALARLRHRVGARVPGTDFIAFPTPAAVLATPVHVLRELGIGSRRAVTLREGASRAAALERLRQVTPEEAMAKIQILRGVGPWTAATVAIGAMAFADGVQVSDAVLPFVATMALTGKAGGDPEMLAALEPYRPHRQRVIQLLELASLMDHEIPGVPRRPLPRIDPHRRTPWKQ
ncbi:MAG: DNA-3-methyladenine glycosylase family protein [Polyangiales bacterium]